MTLLDPPVRPASSAPPWLDELDLVPGPPIHRLGLRSLAASEWLQVTSTRVPELELKRALHASSAEVFAALEGTAPLGALVAELVVEHYRADHGMHLGELDPSAHPLDAVGRMVQEDLLLMSKVGGELVLSAGSLCFPSGWRLLDKLGRGLGAIHAPVSRYDEEIGDRVDRFFARLGPDRIAWRRNWFIHDDSRWFVPVKRSPNRGVDTANAGRRLVLRTERQTVRRLTADAALFTVGTDQVLLEALGDRPDIASAMASYLRASPVEARRGKGAEPYLAAALACLDDLAGC